MNVPDILIVGTAASVPDAEHDTVGLFLRGEAQPPPSGGEREHWAVTIDCAGSPLHRLARAGVGLNAIRAALLTHDHADHLYGLPMLAQGLWLAGRHDPLPIYGPRQAIDRARALLDLFDLERGGERFKADWHVVPMEEGLALLEVEGVRITSTPVAHTSHDTLALRFDHVASGRSAVYSADTAPCQALVRLAAGADLLIHEATGAGAGHSSPAEAAWVAGQAGVRRLALIHYPVVGTDLEAWRRQAADHLPSAQVVLARDGDVYPL